ncbi:8-oxo-dGTP pyrophosphatase MutT (NUDIX family) [Microbacterium natoriense]|uniref:8-oxo-dGTP pyrophosphatase MutT (NUDIX family) n=1 Tax=Microbacterium natoriense TaxID=284570 RepID=A0AAW8EY42_9MICO|nr:NUDIX domain-containing protein [Microbacterium natoriense]MDQ0647922.1 8-oxo-dGTP pyrophosphatase MutT (NUDIX family) [Microbacterium natoriense]
MTVSPYVTGLRAHVGHDLLLLPAVTAVIRDGHRYLLAKHRGASVWGTIGGAIEPGEEPADAVAREVLEEIGLAPQVGSIVGAYGGEDFVFAYPNGDRVSYITIAFLCAVPRGSRFTFTDDELSEARWFTRDEIATLPREVWIDRILDDADRTER